MEPKPLTSSQTVSNKLVPIVVSSVLITALIVGGGVYAYQKNQSDKTRDDLQTQIISLLKTNSAKNVAVSAAPLPSTNPTSTTIPTATVNPTATISALTVSQLMNFTYNDLNGKGHTMKNGVATYPALGGGTGTMTILQDVEAQQIDLNADGAIDTVLIIGENDGGTGYYYQLVSVLNSNGKPLLSGQHSIFDDRATIKNLAVSNGSIIVNGLTSGVGQSRSDLPNQPKTETYKWIKGTLTAQQ